MYIVYTQSCCQLNVILFNSQSYLHQLKQEIISNLQLSSIILITTKSWHQWIKFDVIDTRARMSVVENGQEWMRSTCIQMCISVHAIITRSNTQGNISPRCDNATWPGLGCQTVICAGRNANLARLVHSWRRFQYISMVWSIPECWDEPAATDMFMLMLVLVCAYLLSCNINTCHTFDRYRNCLQIEQILVYESCNVDYLFTKSQSKVNAC